MSNGSNLKKITHFRGINFYLKIIFISLKQTYETLKNIFPKVEKQTQKQVFNEVSDFKEI